MIVNTENMDALENTFSAAFKGAFDAASEDESALMRLAVPSKTKRNYYTWLGMLPQMREWLGDRVLNDLAMHDYYIQNRKFELSFKVERDEIEDDTFGTFTPVAAALGEQAGAHPAQLCFELLANCRTTAIGYDDESMVGTAHPHEDLGTVSNDQGGAGTPWFLMCLSRPIKPIIWQTRRDYQFRALDDLTSERGFMREEFAYGVDARVNAGVGLWQLVYGSQQTLDATNFNAAWEAMAGQTNDAGNPMRIIPTHLVVPTTLRAEGRALLEAERLASGASNTNFKAVALIVSPWL